MSALWWLAATWLTASAAAPAALPVAVPAAGPFCSQEEPTAVWWTLPSKVEVGEPFRWLLEVRHAEGQLAELDDQLAVFAAGLEPSWALLAPEPLAATPEADGWVRRRVGWSAVSLEPGTRELPQMTLVFSDGRSVTTEPATIEIGGVLGESEDSPRPALGLRPAFEDDSEITGAEQAVAAAAALVSVAVLVYLLRRRRRADDAQDEATAEELLRERLAGLQGGLPSGSAEVRAAFYELSALVRGAFDDRAGRDRRGLTDEEWALTVRGDEALPPEARADLERFLARCGEIKYAAAVPTEWALREDLNAVRGALGER